MTAAFVITGDEWQALAAVDHLACRLYLVLRRCMDFRTGVVGGPLKAISWQALREHTEVPGRPGVRYFRPTEQQLRRRVEQLEKCGLLRRISEGLTLKFRMLLARTDSCVQKKAGGDARGEKKPEKSSRGGGSRQGSPGRRSAKAGTHPFPGNTSIPSSPPYSTHREEEGRDEPQTEPGFDAFELGAGEQPVHRLSEQPRRDADAVGDGPAGRLAEGADGARPWSPVLVWPRRIPMHERAAVAHQLAALPHDRRQRVLDEWDGSMGGGQIKRPWLFFASLVAKATGPGWVPEYADRVRDAREQQVRADAALRSQRLAPVDAPQAPKSLSPAVLRLRALVKPRGGQ
ncbi:MULTISPECIES: hypothetical protein [Ralstonia solanacearum species complex]|uniref:hypothetical protein n=1 Tax=Ralstonia solanacearum species complex TaxID=3116862 RepID=UPI000321BBB7|nr:hypothetical protein [Ralstonia pseudosolanacearum]AST27257.1 hypothetical protein CDC45_08635 [Ralstonia pseudosolanacearum]MDC6286792.1 hypothetical protein [Ralstonia pseudosolanacearum]